MNKSKAIVSFAKDGREYYTEAIIRIAKTAISTGFEGDIFLYILDNPRYKDTKIVFNTKGNFVQIINNYPVINKYSDLETNTCKPNFIVPYQFKPFAIQSIREMGYDQVLWMDSTAFICRNLSSAFEFLDSVGLVMPDNQGCPEAVWTSDDCLIQVGCDFERAKNFFEIMACVMMFDFTMPIPNTVFDEYIDFSIDGISYQGVSGSNRPEFKAHRHDQSVISAILDKYCISHVPYGFIIYSFPGSEKYASYIINWGTGPLPPSAQKYLIDPVTLF